MQARKEYLEVAIAEITAQLKRPMSDLERQLLVADRKDAREELEKLKMAP